MNDELEDKFWEGVVTHAWEEDLADARQDIYSLEDGEAVEDK